MKKSIKLKPAVLALSALAVLAVAVVFLVLSGIIKSSASDDAPVYSNVYVGRYMHVSGDESKYIEVYDDGTIQVFGRDLYEETVNLPVNKKNYESFTEEQLEETLKDLREHSDWFSQRHNYTVKRSGQSSYFVKFDDSPFGVGIIGEKTLESGDNIYVYEE